ncbi:hypothetical protein MNBD_GAMMA17-1513 [hydrothermal vent metagenome]|uniref:CheW-like domain-containing protein n=1 Tax=hydrothermal vent metagenome TaxID=652676 RepID=A0A3B1A254_9ZZZZ
MNDKKSPPLATQSKALTQYLDSLLMEVPEEVPVVDVAIAVIDKTDVIPEAAVSSQVEVQDVVESRGQIQDQIPEWGMAPFKALFFNVGDITLAVPLEKLSGILTECDDIKVMPGNSERYLGVLVHRGKTIRVIDFEGLVAELSGEPRVPSSGESLPSNRIILIEGERIGIACRNVTDVEEIEPNDVRWRVGSTKRPWYRGIVVEKMCALLDIDALLSLLSDDADVKH